MVTRLYEGDKNETGGTGIEVTDNKVINLILRSLNNLIKVNDNNEVYVDLQLEDGIENSDTLPIGVNVGRVLAADGRPVTGTLISGQTTSGDRVKVLYGDNGNIYMDNGTGVWHMLGVNTMTFFLENDNDLTTAQAILNYVKAGKNPIISYGSTKENYTLIALSSTNLRFMSSKLVLNHYMTQGVTKTVKYFIDINYSGDTATNINISVDERGSFLDCTINYDNAYVPQYNGSPATKKYVDSRVVIDSNAPTTPQAGQFWYDTTSSTLSLYDGTQRLSI